MSNTLKLHESTIPILTEADSVLVGVSGGRDSVALLVLLTRLPGCSPVVCHLHHGIRRDEADRDAEFAEKLAEELELPFLMEKVDVPRLADERKISVEAAARQARQEFFLRLKDAGHGDVVALAQHQDDQAETILMNLCRGSVGLKGMDLVSTWANGLTVLRPLLECSRQEITQFLTDEEYAWVEDGTNAETDYTRNAFRHKIIPELDALMQRQVTPLICRAESLLKEQSSALGQAIDLLEPVDPQGRLFLPKVCDLPRELKKSVVFAYLKDGGVPDLSEDCVNRILDILPVEAPSKVSLPGGWIASRKEQRLRLVPPPEMD